MNEKAIIKDCYRYEDIAHVILDEPEDSWRNKNVFAARANGATEEDIKLWTETYDRCLEAVPDGRKTQVAANFAVDPRGGRGLSDRARIADRASQRASLSRHVARAVLGFTS